MNPEPVTSATFVTFYSFKGGVGRSMALINTAGILAGLRGFRVLVVDLDLEAPGLTYLNPESPDAAPLHFQQELPLQHGFVDLMTDAVERGEEADLFTLSDAAIETKYTRKIKIPDTLREFTDGALHIMPAGRLDHDYSRRLDALNLNALYREGLGEPLIRAFKKKLAESGRYHYVLVDSRTGISEGAGICTRDLADHVMVLSGLNRQNVEGTSEFLREFRAATGGKKTVQIILSPVPNGEDELLDRRRAVAEQRFEHAWGEKVGLSLEIPYHPQLALTEEPHIFRRRRGYLFEAYRKIEANMLVGLGHDAPTFQQRIRKSLDGKLFKDTLQELHHMIRLDRGQAALSRLVDELISGRQSRQSVDKKPPQESVTLERLLAQGDGKRVAEFIVENLSIGERDWQIKRLLRELEPTSPELAQRLVNRILEASTGNAETLGDYAVDFARRGRLEAAAAFYERAVEADPLSARNLGNYAIFLERQERLQEAEAFYKRAITANPEVSTHLSNYADYLENRGRFVEADVFYKSAIEANPTDARNLGRYAIFLRDRERFDEAEPFYKRAIDADPANSHCLRFYAVFLDRQDRTEEAEELYKRAINIDSENPATLSDYGQFLAGTGRIDDGERHLLQAAKQLESAEIGDAAEVCFSLWLVSRMRDRDAANWERRFKFLIIKGFKRHTWSFSRMIRQAEKQLSVGELEYAKALAAAFLDESRVTDLAKFPQWQALEPLEPNGAPADLASQWG